MKIEALRNDLAKYLRDHGLIDKFEKAAFLIGGNVRHPSLNVELLEPKWRGIYSFRIDIKYRALFFINKKGLAEIFSITNHYKR